MTRILHDVRNTFGEGNIKNYDILNNRLDNRASWPEIRSLLAVFWTKDVTDINDDAAMCFLLKDGGDEFRLELSGVGPYFLILKIEEDYNKLLNCGDISSDRRLSAALSSVQENRLLLDQKTLEAKVDLGYSDEASNLNLYNTLFSDVERLPWS